MLYACVCTSVSSLISKLIKPQWFSQPFCSWINMQNVENSTHLRLGICWVKLTDLHAIMQKICIHYHMKSWTWEEGRRRRGGGCGSTCVHMNMSLFCLLGGAALAKVCKKSNWHLQIVKSYATMLALSKMVYQGIGCFLGQTTRCPKTQWPVRLVCNSTHVGHSGMDIVFITRVWRWRRANVGAVWPKMGKAWQLWTRLCACATWPHHVELTSSTSRVYAYMGDCGGRECWPGEGKVKQTAYLHAVQTHCCHGNHFYYL